MSWDYKCNENGELEIIVSRWYNRGGNYRVTLMARGFEPNEPVQVEVLGGDEDAPYTPYTAKGG